MRGHLKKFPDLPKLSFLFSILFFFLSLLSISPTLADPLLCSRARQEGSDMSVTIRIGDDVVITTSAPVTISTNGLPAPPGAPQPPPPPPPPGEPSHPAPIPPLPGDPGKDRSHDDRKPPGPPSQGYKSIVYFVNWGIYGRQYQPADLPVEKLTHVLYAFANIQPTGQVVLTDTYADLEKHYEGDSWNDTGHNVYGCIKQLFLLKKRNRNLKLLLSIGGWTYSQNNNFADLASAPASRQVFAESCLKLVLDLGFDGVDIDWEYPRNTTEAENFVLLLKNVREVFDNAQKDRYFYLTAASAAGPAKYQLFNFKGMDQYLDFWNLMAYDFAGSFDPITGHHTNIYSANNSSTPFNGNEAVNAYISNGVPSEKIVLGMPLYGRAFQGATGFGQPYTGVGPGSWENGVWDYKALPLPGAEEKVDENLIAGWCEDQRTQTLVSYDTVASTKLKTGYIQHQKLGGAMWWEATGDRSARKADAAEGSLIGTFVDGVGGVNALERTDNVLDFPESQYDNIRSG